MAPLYFRENLLAWYRTEKRDLPWRNTSDPYRIWVSEIIMQQTRIDQGLAYYERFVDKFPSVTILALANEEEILKEWQGLGYYSRARNMHFAAKQIVTMFDSQFPNSAEQLNTIKGIGSYTSAAIASIAFNEPIAAIDGNVFRVLTRVFGIDEPIDTTKGKKKIQKLANELLDTKHPGDYNQAIMDFGALQCKPRNPECNQCTFKNSCAAFGSNNVSQLPVKSKKTKITNRYFNYLVIKNDDSIFVKKRDETDIWKNLYDFPLIETPQSVSFSQLTETDLWKSIFQNSKLIIESISEEKIHILSHQKIHHRFITISLTDYIFLPSKYIKIMKKNIFELAVPKVIENYIETNLS